MADVGVIRKGIRWLDIDPWNQIQHAYGRESIPIYQENAIKKIKHFARKRNIGVIVVAHPTKEFRNPRTGELRVPGLYDIDGSSHWVNAPEYGIVIDRPDHTDTPVRVIVKKSRYHNIGKPGEGWLYFGSHRYFKTSAPEGTESEYDK